MKYLVLSLLTITTFFGYSKAPGSSGNIVETILLEDNWNLSSSKALSVSLQELSSKGDTSNVGWVQTSVPNSVLGSLVQAGVYKDIYSGMNMKDIPTEQFKTSWVYHNSFEYDVNKKEFYTLDLDGINYKANIWLNGKQIADTATVFGVYKQYQFDISKSLQKTNNLVIEVFPPVPGDFTIGFVDWAPVPADNNMGIWRNVAITRSKSVTLDQTFVYADFDVKNAQEADLHLSTVLSNNTKKKQKLTLKGVLTGEDGITIDFTHQVTLEALTTKEIKLSPKDIPALKVVNPKLWWPHTLGEPNLYKLNLQANVGDQVSSSETVTFGIRKVEDYINEFGHRGYIINGHKILIKGAGWVDDLILNNTHEYDEAQVLYAKDMNFNTIRFEGFWGKNEDLYSLCDQHGLLAMVGFSCQWEWSDYLGGKKFNEEEDGFGGVVEPHERELVANYFKDQVLWLRNHPSIFVYSVGSDRLPHPELELAERKILETCDPSRPMLTSAKYMVSQHSGPSAVKMEGPYDYVTPNYWYTDTVRGGAFGFNTETGPGPQPPVIYSIEKMIPNETDRWPLDNEMWKYHSGRHAFGDMSKYLKAFDARYGASDNVEDFAAYAQIASYEAMRPMYEAFAVNRPNTTGIIQWMLNSAWPETYWQLYDSYLHPTGAYYGAKKGSRDLNVIFNYGDYNIYASNETKEAFHGQVYVQVLDTLSQVVYQDTLNTGKFGGATSLLDLNTKIDTAKLKGYFVDLVLVDLKGDEVVDNFYWLSSKPDVIDPDYKNSSWIYTPNLSFGDLNYIRHLPKAQITYKVKSLQQTGGKTTGEVEVINSASVISFFNEFTVLDKATGKPVLPVTWSDNYISLLPNQSKTIKFEFNDEYENIEVKLNGINSSVK
ncbi:glycoside hydrolase family 2 [Cyclobacteriaceae bacterium]|nr:glycoside hydrolase family 2 [Cyclobacteriaceae bacterium]